MSCSTRATVNGVDKLVAAVGGASYHNVCAITTFSDGCLGLDNDEGHSEV